MSSVFSNAGGKLKIKDDVLFLRLLSGIEGKDAYDSLRIYGRKQLSKTASDINFMEHDSIINWAIVKASSGFDPENEAGASFLTYFNMKLKGEITDFRQKKIANDAKVLKVVNEDRENFQYKLNKETGENEFEQITNVTPETIIEEQSAYSRKMQAFRMAFSTLPKNVQHTLKITTLSDLGLAEVAIMENTSIQEITKRRNVGLSLILNKVLRSKQLTDEEKEDLINEKFNSKKKEVEDE